MSRDVLDRLWAHQVSQVKENGLADADGVWAGWRYAATERG
jgi:hypothetical protein